jgi:predicted KAP-like P-loop ATPase
VRSGDAITSRAEDRLDRSGFADHLAAALRQASADRGLVVALMGDWGSGKTSVLNMVKERLDEAPARTVLTFNPWMFSGTEQLLGAFFEQVGGQLRLKGGATGALADQLINYGRALSPLVFVPVAGAWLGRIGAAANAAATARAARKAPDPVEKQRQAIEEALGKLADPIVVIIDDIDRLTPAEVRSMLGLVRLTAHFPKVIYLLAFDRAKVERALGEGGLEDGRSYLGKIVEVVYDMPAISQPQIERLLLEGIDQVITGVTTGPFDEDRWPDVFSRILRPLLSTPREVNRFLAPLPAMLGLIGEEVALADVLALEALRVRLPDVFAQLEPMASALTDAGMRTSQAPDWQGSVLAFTGSAGPHEPVVQDLCRLLFPATERYLGGTTSYPSDWLPRWRRDRRVASPEVFGIYLSKQVPPGTLPAAVVDRAVAALTDRQAFQAVMDSVGTDDLDDLLARLETYEEAFPREAAKPACTVLLGLYPRLRTRSLGFLDPGPEIAVDRVVLRLLRRVEEPERTRVVEALCAGVTGFTGPIRLLYLAGRLPNPDYERLIPAADSDRLYRQVCYDMRHASPAQLAAERDPLVLLAGALAQDPGDRDDIDRALRDDQLCAALLASAVAEVRSQPLGSLATRTQQFLRWEELRTVAGNDDTLGELVDRAATVATGNEDLAAAVVLAREYQSGWRPTPGPLARRPLVIRPPLVVPNMIFSPSVTSGWPALLLRAATTYEVDPIFAAKADVAGRPFHDRLAAFLAGLPLATQIASLAEARGLDASTAGWQPDSDAAQMSRAAVQRLVLGPDDQPAAILRYAVFLPDNTGPMKLISDIFLSPGIATDAKWGRLKPEEVRDLMAAALESSVGPLAAQILRSIFGETPPRTGMELYLWSAQGQSTDGRPSNTLASTIDLDTLGTPTRPDQPPQQGIFAVAGDTPTATSQEYRYLSVQALIRMALDWGYLDAPAGLLPLAP